jgi:type I restriction enzyme S subunit
VTYLAVQAAVAVPQSWRTSRLRHVAVLTREKREERNIRLLSLSVRYGIRYRDEGGLGRQAPSEASLASYWVVRPGDVVVNPMWLLEGSVAVTQLSGAVSPAYRVYRPSRDSDGRFLAYLLGSRPYLEQYQLMTRGLTTFDRAVQREDLDDIPVSLPTVAEQRRIADFLDAETGRIDRLIELRASTSALVNARTQSALSELFASETWHPSKLKHLLARGICYGVLVPRYVDGDGVRLIRVNDLNDLDGRAPDLVQIDRALSAEYSRTIVRAGDLLVAVVGSCGVSAIVPQSAQGANLARAVARLQVRAGVHAFVLWSWTQTPDFRRQVALATASDTAQPTLNVSDLSDFTLSVPGSAGEWRRAAAAGQEIIGWRDQALRLAGSHLRLLAERRSTLITAAVTGQLDVTTARGAA